MTHDITTVLASITSPQLGGFNEHCLPECVASGTTTDCPADEVSAAAPVGPGLGLAVSGEERDY